MIGFQVFLLPLDNFGAVEFSLCNDVERISLVAFLDDGFFLLNLFFFHGIDDDFLIVFV